MSTRQEIKDLKTRVRALELRAAEDAYMQAFKAISEDMHAASGRPCGTCRLVTNVIGRPFGCYAFQQKNGGI